jgi:hypothetical protein
MKNMEQLSNEYKDTALDFSQPFMKEAYHLHLQNPNDAEFGKEVRKILVNAKIHNDRKNNLEAMDQLRNILSNEGDRKKD